MSWMSISAWSVIFLEVANEETLVDCFCTAAGISRVALVFSATATQD